MTDLIEYSKIDAEMEKAETVPEILALDDKIRAAMEYCKASKMGLEAQNEYAGRHMILQRKAGGALAELERWQGKRNDLTLSMLGQSEYKQALEENYISRQAAARMQNIWRIPENKFNHYIESQKSEGKEITTNGLMKVANYKADTKKAVDSDEYVPKGMDACQTPAYAIDPILPYLRQFDYLWEPAAGEKYLVEAMYDASFKTEQIIISDILTGDNFFDFEPDRWDCIFTNPPFSIKFKWLNRCYELGKPFALLMPVETLGTQTAQHLFRDYGMELILLDKRIDFKMPVKGWEGSAQFPTAWYTWGLGIGSDITYATIDKG